MKTAIRLSKPSNPSDVLNLNKILANDLLTRYSKKTTTAHREPDMIEDKVIPQWRPVTEAHDPPVLSQILTGGLIDGGY